MEEKKLKILAIDDNPDNLITLRALLGEVFPLAAFSYALSGEKGLELARTEEPDIILLDIIMPELDGYEVCRRIKEDENLADIPVVFLTALKGERENKIKALESGGEAFLSKPLDEVELTAQIKAMAKIREANLRKRHEKEILSQEVEKKTHELEKSHAKTLDLVRDLMRENETRRLTESALAESEQKYRQLAENISDVIWSSTMDFRTTYISPSIEKLTGYSPNTYMKLSPDERFTLDSLNRIQALYFSELKEEERDSQNKERSKIIEVEQYRSDGSTVWVEINTGFIRDKQGKAIGLQGVSRDISEKKKAEEKLKYLIYHDQLTGLPNRVYVWEKLQEIDRAEHLPLAIIYGDINGLKEINDSLGNTAGDKMILKVAETIKEICFARDITARLGGDEFLIVSPNTDESLCEMIIERIKDELAKSDFHKIGLTISFGYEVKKTIEEDIREAIIKAEDSMYRYKLYENKSARGKLIDVIMGALYEKSNREQMHSQRVSKFCEMIATALKLKKEIVNQIRMAGLLHDIGKIGIAETILNKPGNLTAEEWLEIKKHPEASWRILSPVPEFAELAEFAFSHHERWDGQGYPRGLKGEEIPLAARIIGVADTYDALTSTRTYRESVSTEDAVQEIERNSGKQFDPRIVEILVSLMKEQKTHAI